MSRPVPSRKSTLVFLTWNRWDLTERCLATLWSTELPNTEILVVDNGSTDETPERLQALEKTGRIRLIRLPENRGFVRGNNVGIEAADPTSDIVLLNNDLELCQEDWLSRLRACAHGDGVGIVGCRLRLPEGLLLHAGTYILPDTIWGQQIGAKEEDIGQYICTREVEGIVFACAYIRREVIDAIGGLALDFESYFEDTDYCLRARDAGFKILLCGDVTLVHNEHGSSDGRVDRLMPVFQHSRQVFRKKWRRELRSRYQHDLLWQSILSFPSGYARSSRDLLRSLERHNVRAVYRYVYGPGSPFPVTEPETTGDHLMDVVRSRRKPLFPKMSVVYGQGDVFERNQGRYKIGFTMLEVDGFPDEWVRQANRMDEIWVPSESNRQAFLRCGLKRPIHQIPLGVDPHYFHPKIEAHPNPHGDLVFLSNFEWGERKEPWLLLKAFNEVFSADEPVRLVCKIINKDPSVSLKEEIRRLELKESGGRISYLFNLVFPHYQLGSLYRSADCYLSISRGEGWDMPLMEALACGLPAIATDWGAHQEFFHAGIGYPLRSRGLVPAVAKCPYYEGFSWADPDPEHLRYLLRHVYENRKEARRKGELAAEEMAERWTWDHAARRIVQRLETLSS